MNIDKLEEAVEIKKEIDSLINIKKSLSANGKNVYFKTTHKPICDIGEVDDVKLLIESKAIKVGILNSINGRIRFLQNKIKEL
jgi:hypothetical protein